MFWSPVVFASPARLPIRVFCTPVVTAYPERYPTATLFISALPEGFCARRASVPIATDWSPATLPPKAASPTATFDVPVVFASNAV